MKDGSCLKLHLAMHKDMTVYELRDAAAQQHEHSGAIAAAVRATQCINHSEHSILRGGLRLKETPWWNRSIEASVRSGIDLFALQACVPQANTDRAPRPATVAAAAAAAASELVPDTCTVTFTHSVVSNSCACEVNNAPSLKSDVQSGWVASEVWTSFTKMPKSNRGGNGALLNHVT